MTSTDLYFRLLAYALPYKATFALSISGTILCALTEPALPALLKPLLDGSFVEQDPTMMILIPLLLVALFIVRGLAGYVGTLAMRWVASRVVMDLRAAMFDTLLRLPVRYFDDHPSGQAISKLTYDVTQVTQASTQVLLVLVRDSVVILGLIGWMLYLNWRLSLVMLLVVPPVAWIIRLISLRLRVLSRSLQGTMGELTHVIQEVAQGNRIVKMFGAEDYEARRFRRANNRVRRDNLKLAMAAEANAPLVHLLAATALAVVVYLATLQSRAGTISVGEFVSLFAAMALTFNPIKRLTKINEKLQMGLAAAQSVFALIDEVPERDAGTGAITRARGEIEFCGVCFAYRTKTARVLQGLDLRIQPGRTVAVVGRSGSGKTTLASLLSRFYVPDAGEIRLDGTDIQALRLGDLRRNIAYVGQDTVLFNDTVAANIAYGDNGPWDRLAITRAAEAAHAMEFIQELPDGLDTLIGDNGVRLSGGQRQRIAIARALLKDAPVLILDEATSALDHESERMVQTALESVRRGRTCLVIAHRLSTVESADRIVVMDRGRIVETGDHRSLLARGGPYARLYRMHDEGFRGVA